MKEHNIQKIIDKLKKERENRIPNLIKWLEEMKPFNEGCIPEPPIMERELYEKYVIPNFIRCGAIPKDELIVGKTYIGNCRNASEAVWNGKVFTYKRTKFGCTYDEDINHFQDDDGYDVFVPIKIKD
jgi:hypothetical protein